MSKFKVGEKVRVLDGSGIKDYKFGWTNSMERYVGRKFEIAGKYESVDGTTAYKLRGVIFKFDERGLEKVKDEKIIIYRNGQEVTAKDIRTGKTATAKCSPSDEFDFYTGAKLAFERLYCATAKFHLVNERGEHYGYCGEKTELEDRVGRPLFIGDVVELFNCNGESRGLKFVVKTGKFPWLLGKRPSVMGIVSSDYLKDGTFEEGWMVVKAKHYSEVEAGEKVGYLTKKAI